MPKQEWAYQANSDRFSGPYDSPEAAAIEGLDDGREVVTVAPIVRYDLTDFAPDAEDVLQTLYERACDSVGEVAGDWPEVDRKRNPAAMEWLDKQLQMVLRRFERKFKQHPTFYGIDSSGERQYRVKRKDAAGRIVEVEQVPAEVTP